MGSITTTVENLAIYVAMEPMLFKALILLTTAALTPAANGKAIRWAFRICRPVKKATTALITYLVISIAPVYKVAHGIFVKLIWSNYGTHIIFTRSHKRPVKGCQKKPP